MTTKPIQARKQPRQRRSNATVESILEAAARILEADGLQALNTNAVAERAGVSIGSLYQYFPGKEAILAELIRLHRQTLMQTLDQFATRTSPASLQDDLNHMIQAAISHQLGRPRLARTLEYAECCLPIGAESKAMQDEINDLLAQRLERAGVDHSGQAAQDLAAMCRGMIDAAGLAGEEDSSALMLRVQRAVWGYLGIRNE